MNDKTVVLCPKCAKKVRVPVGKHVQFHCPKCNEHLDFDDRPESEKVADSDDQETSFSDSMLNFTSWIIVIPAFIILHKLLPDPDWPLNIDRLLIGISLLLIVRILLKSFKLIVLGLLFGAFIWLGYGTIWGNYGFGGLYKDYKAMIFSMIQSPHPESIIISKLKPFKDKTAITNAIDFDNPEVRNFALSATRDFQKYAEKYTDYRTLIQCFAVFKKIKNSWNYVSDPASRDYFAKASESIQHLSGDCDDHAILMAACIKSMGGTPRLIHTTRHLYPEILIGDKKDLEAINYIIKKHLFRTESYNQILCYHIDEFNQVWLNMDYTAKYPGGPFMSEEILGVLALN